MYLPKVNLVVVGHKDHGKSTLIGRLLYDSKAIPEEKVQEIREELKKSGRKGFEFAFILDSLEEERRGGLTIDIVQTPFRSAKYSYTIIDCPGHREFIRKMLTGASQADACILVVSVKEGIEDQTRQHLFLTRMLGIRQLVVAANKIDVVRYDRDAFEGFSGSLKEVLSSLGCTDAPIVPVSALYGDNVATKSDRTEWYKGQTLIETLDNSIVPPQPPLEKPLRCLVQDVFEIKGEKLVVCRLETGSLKVGQRVIAMPMMEEGDIERVELCGEEAVEAFPGDSIGLVVRGIGSLRRGHVLCDGKEALRQTQSFLVQLVVFSDFELREGDIVTIRVGTAETRCRVMEILDRIDPVELVIKEYKPRSLRNGEVGKVLFQPLESLYVDEYSSSPQLGRLVIIGRRGAVAAGMVLAKS